MGSTNIDKKILFPLILLTFDFKFIFEFFFTFWGSNGLFLGSGKAQKFFEAFTKHTVRTDPNYEIVIALSILCFVLSGPDGKEK